MYLPERCNAVLMTIALTSVYALVMFAQQGEPQPFSRLDGRLVYRVVALCPSANDISALRSCRDTLSLKPTSEVPFSEVIVTADRRELSLLRNIAPGMSGGSEGFDQVQQAIREIDAIFPGFAGLESEPILRTIHFRGSVVEIYRGAGVPDLSSDGIVKVVSKGTDDSQLLQASDGIYTLLWLDESGFGGIFPSSPRLHVFLYSPTFPTCKGSMEAYQILRKIFSLSGVESMHLRIRMDTWFDGAHFPKVYRFEKNSANGRYLGGRSRRGPLAVPSVEEYYRSSELSLYQSDSAEPPRCNLLGAWPERFARRALGVQ